MLSRLNQALLGASLLTLLACSSGGDSKAPTIVTGPGYMPSTTTPVFDPANANVPLPNVLATATAADPLTGRAPNKPMTPPEALAYVNLHEMGGTNAVSGLNAPIYLQFNAAVDATTVTAANVKVFQITPDATGTENNPLGFADVSGLFTYQYTAGGTDLFLFPNFPLLPGTRYLYVVTNRVKDTAGKPISASPYFEALKSTTPLTGSFAALEPVRANVLSGSTILFSGYAKVMNDLIAASATTTVAQRSDITVMGRFLTTGAGVISATTTIPSASGAVLLPVESARRKFAAGATLGGLSGKTWSNAATIPANT
ncbi:MAG TPA: Ig-like domain-containing protein, partial [Geobacteraceae bacterium]